MAQIKKETHKRPLALYLEKIRNVIEDDNSCILTGHQISKKSPGYAFYLRKPFLPIGLPFQYRTALLAEFKEEGENTIIEIQTQTPPFITIMILVACFGLVFDSLILKSSFSMESKLTLFLLMISVIIYHYATKSKIDNAFREEITDFV